MKTKISCLKTGIVLIALFSISTLVTQAQTWTVGPKAGASFNMLSNTDNAKFGTGVNAGVFALYSKWSHFGISADVLYNQRVSKYTAPIGFGDAITTATFEPSLGYLDVPVLANFFFMDPSALVRPKISLGPSFGFLLKDQGSTQIYNTFDVGAVGGVGVNVRLAERIWLNVDGRYNHGFLDVSEGAETNDNMNRNISATAGIGFGIGK